MIGSAVQRLAGTFTVRYRDEQVPASPQELAKNIADADAVLCYLDDRFDAQVMDKAPTLKAIANVAVGYDNIDVPEATNRGILVFNTPGVLTDATADLSIALLLDAARRLSESDRYVRNGKWKGWTPDLMLGQALRGKTLGIVGMGRIGEAVAHRACAFGMKIIYTRRGNEENDARLLHTYGADRVSLGELLKNADAISVHCPLNQETRHMIGKSEFAGMKKNCILVNTARGAVIDQDALIDALRNRQIAAAGLDVFQDEPNVPQALIEMENVVLAPHIGSATIETRTAMTDLAADGLISAFSGAVPFNTINREAWSKSPLSISV
jgi:lactate dehydrogenase-like 2-hydroxyacid dehydrogenase